ncbi:biopolymer transporter ExbD [Hydrococcus rivularis NIES-593]|uniref:Biopolymer transporter ExbD n=1 Tax=Hydrococcus rivularis NIES-593 TaxID=1921803 RepID=A0A1U7HBE9_9CYAN|nr:biopolymer transporter ExbD [Hydrococcus rivularis]OKH20899.1 biopolymer transporter ExbD [Hydrococcus rivularis NIES-593]
MRLQDERDESPLVNLIPMIDVIFAILTFFIMSTLFLTRSEGLPVNLPKAATAKEQQVPAKATVTIDKDGKISLNRQSTTIEALEGEVKAFIGNKPEAVVIINADEGVHHGQVVTVMDKVRRIPGAKLAIATQKPN